MYCIYKISNASNYGKEKISSKSGYKQDYQPGQIEVIEVGVGGQGIKVWPLTRSK
jgi:hypothetical protein